MYMGNTNLNINSNAHLIEVLKDIVTRANHEGRKFMYFDHNLANKVYESSLNTIVKLLEMGNK